MNIYRGSIVVCFAFFSDGMNLCAHIYVCLNHSSHYIYIKKDLGVCYLVLQSKTTQVLCGLLTPSPQTNQFFSICFTQCDRLCS